LQLKEVMKSKISFNITSPAFKLKFLNKEFTILIFIAIIYYNRKS
jgi:acetoacetate decarboxylase